MSEYSEQDSLPASPLQAKGLFDLIQELEAESGNINMHIGYSVFTGSIPGIIDANAPDGVVSGHPEIPHSFIIDYKADSVRQSPADSEFSYFKISEFDNHDKVYVVSARAKEYEDDPELFPYLTYQQTAEIEIERKQEVPTSHIEIVTKFEYSFWVDQNDAYFIHREVSQHTRPNVDGEFINQERMQRTMLMVQLDEVVNWPKLAIEAYLDSITPSDDESYENSLVDGLFSQHEPTEYEIEAARSIQCDMLNDRIAGHGIVSVAEAEALRSLLASTRPS